MKKLIIPILCMICLGVVLADNHFDYTNTESYKDEQFYPNSNPQEWNYNDPNFNWDEALKNNRVYTSPTFFSNLPENRYKDLDYNQVDYTLITDHQKINAQKFIRDFGCDRCHMTTVEGLRFEKGTIVHKDGAFVRISSSFPPNVLLLYEDNRFIARLPPETSELPSLEAGHLGFEIDSLGNIDTPVGVRVEKGTISCTDQRCIALEGDQIEIQGIRFSAPNGDPLEQEVEFYSAEITADIIATIRESEKPTIVADPFTLKLFAHNWEDLELTFLPANDFIETEKPLVVRLGKGTSFTIEERGNQDLIPLITVQAGPTGPLTAPTKLIYDIDNPSHALHLKGKITYVNSDHIRHQSFSLQSLYADGTNALEVDWRYQSLGPYKDIPSRIVVSQDGIISIPARYDDEFTSFTERVTYNRNVPLEVIFREQFPHIALLSVREATGSEASTYGAFDPKNSKRFISEGVPEQKIIRQVMQALETLPDGVVSSIAGIEVFRDEDYNIVMPRSGAFTRDDRIIRVPLRNVDSETFAHEGTHNKVDVVQANHKLDVAQNRFEYYKSSQGEVYFAKLAELSEDYDQLVKSGHEDLLNHPIAIALANHRSSEPSWIARESFESKWREVTAGAYGIGLGPKDVKGNAGEEGELSSTWADGTEGPRNGCVRAYGCNNFDEDTATYVEKANYRNSEISDLISPTNTDKRYVRKYALLHENNFLHNGWLEEMMRGVGYEQSCIDAATSRNGFNSPCLLEVPNALVGSEEER